MATFSRGVPCAVVLAALLSARTGLADVCPAPAYAPAVAALDSRARAEFLERAFDREIHDVDLWSWVWGSVYAAGTGGQAVLLPFAANQGKRTDLYVGMASTAFGAVSLWGLPLQLTLPLRGARGALRGGGDPCAALARAERTLLGVEKDQVFANGIVAHLGNVAANVAVLLILGVGYHHWPSAALSVGVGVPLGEANAFTQPHHLTDVLGHYRAGQLDFRGTPGPALAWSLVPVVGPGGSGAAFRLAW